MVEKINGQTGTITRVKGSIIVIGDDQTIDPTYRGKTLDGTLTQITSDFTSVNTLLAKKIEADDITASFIQSRFSSSTFTIGGGISCGSITSTGTIDATGAISASDFVLRGTATSLKNAYNSVRQTTSGGNVTLYFKDFNGTEDSVTFSKAATLQATYGGSNQGTQATYTVTGSPAGNFPSGATTTGTFTLHINASAAWVTDPNGTIRARIANPADTDAAYNSGWNDCRNAALNSGSTLNYYTGSVTTKYDAPSVGAQGREVIYPYSSHSRTVYTIPNAK